MRFFIELSFNGKVYHGWQNQPNAISVQEVLEKALSTILKTEISIMGAGRTDSGVHASQMFAHFDFENKIESTDLIYKLNSFLPKDIAITSIFEVKPEAHARFDALSRTYHYKISTSKNVFDYEFAYQVQLPLDVEAMNKACKILFEYKDFQCFSKSNTDVKTYNCDIKEAFWAKKQGQLVFTIKADRFLRNMVRAIVGTMVNIGLGKLKANDLHQIIASKNRSEAGFSVPAHGLYLAEIVYPERIKL
ncbi:tRNA pseudouridine(38-40) synthase TruA [Winogradskyella schleiferi]|uniref:tRNA pseudouridine(38-40) synthase TruA n=1 Tax=Winogradskyella schleiferi TaxID=2686078 RepID=UPI0015BCA2B0|nr:tRNA pseudouridine(38-40) synthase TruA [Winogradskyella schleiferi]